MGALAGVFPFDEVTVSYMRSRISEFSNPNAGKTRPKSRSGYSKIESTTGEESKELSAVLTQSTQSIWNSILPRWFTFVTKK